jgi:hypothetical protein
MIRSGAIWRLRMWPAAALASFLSTASFVVLDSPASAQSIMRSPNLNISSRAPSLAAPHITINPNLGGSVINGLNENSIRTRSPCTAADRDSGNCSGQVASSSKAHKNNKSGTGTGNASGASLALRAVTNEIVAEIDGALSETQIDALARRHGLQRIESQNFELLGTTIGLFRITGRKTFETASREFAQDGSVHSVQSNFRYALQDQNAGASEGDPGQ